jgi:hypothetical protein
MAWLESVLPRLVLGAGGALLFASLFMPWFDGGVIPLVEDAAIDVAGGGDISGWEAFDNADILLTLAVLGAFACVVLADVLEARWPYLGAVVIGGAALCLTLFAIYRPANAIPVGQGGLPEVGFLCALLGAGGVTIGGLWCGLERERGDRA